jgi:hypothetical protein
MEGWGARCLLPMPTYRRATCSCLYARSDPPGGPGRRCRRTGADAVRRRPTTRTPYAVFDLVAKGMTNKEVAATMMRAAREPEQG